MPACLHSALIRFRIGSANSRTIFGVCQTIVPDEAIETDYVMKAILNIKAGTGKKESEDLLAAAAAHLEARGAEVLVLGCTEIPLAFNPQRATVPVVNGTRVLAEASIRTFQEMSRNKKKR